MFSLFSRLDLQRIYVNEDTPKRMCKGEHGGQRFNKGFMVDSLSWRSYKFSQQLFLKNYYLNLKFFKYCRVLSLKRKKNLLKKDASYLKIAWHSQRQKKKALKKEKEKRKMRKSQTTTINIFFLLLLFYTEAFTFYWKHLEKLSLYWYIFVTAFLCGRLLEMR